MHARERASEREREREIEGEDKRETENRGHERSRKENRLVSCAVSKMGSDIKELASKLQLQNVNHNYILGFTHPNLVYGERSTTIYFCLLAFCTSP